MKILHIVINGIYTEGMAYQDNVLPDMHCKMGHSVCVMASCQVFDEGKVVTVPHGFKKLDNGARLYRVPFLKLGTQSLTYKFRIVPGMYRLIEKISPDFIMMHGLSSLSIYSLKRYMKNHPNVRLIVDNHADYSNSATNWVSRFFMHKLVWKRVAHAIEPYVEKFYGVLPARVEFLKELYKLPTDKCELLVMGAEDDKVEIATAEKSIRNTRLKYGIEQDDFLIVTGGKIDRAKTQVLLLMEAVKKMNLDNVKLLIFGSVVDDLKHKFDTLVDDERIKYIGWLSSDDTYPVIAAADLAVYPGRHSTLWEQTVGTGIPMVCKYWDGTTHVDVCGNVLFLNVDNEDEIYEVINSIISDVSVLNKMKQSALKAMDVFSYRKIAERCIELR